jgi:nicotinamidase-related amidase
MEGLGHTNTSEAAARGLPIPPHFDAAGVGKVWRVPYQQRAAQAEAWARGHQIPAAASDAKRVCLLLVDCQNTFCIPGFELFVAGRSGNGAVEDNLRLCRFIYQNLPAITRIIPTLDTHAAMQIFHPIFWVNGKGEHPKGGQTVISLEDVRSGNWKVNPAMADSVVPGGYEKLRRYAEHYVGKLTEAGKYPLMIWPYHAMLGGIGHALVSSVEEAVFFHAIARKSQMRCQIKGEHPLTEHYSVLHTEVRQDEEGKAIAGPGSDLLETLLGFDALIIAGQAKSHCVAWTVDDLLGEPGARAPGAADKVYLLEDCTSPVVVPGVVDFTERAGRAFQRFAEAGTHIVKSTTPMEHWPGMQT